MGKENVKKLKARFGVKESCSDLDKYFNLIDATLFDTKIFVEEWDHEKNCHTYSFEDGTFFRIFSDEYFVLLSLIADVVDVSDQNLKNKDGLSGFEFN